VAKRDYQRDKLDFTFVPLPFDVIQSDEWRSLPPNAIRLAIDLMSQYTGKNNGRLCPAWVVMERYGWKTERTLIDAKRALLECTFVVHTRQGKAPRTTDWVGFTWWPLHWHESMDVPPRGWPKNNFVRIQPVMQADPSTGRLEPVSKTLRALQKLQDGSQKLAAGPAETTGHKLLDALSVLQKLQVVPNETTL